MVKTAEQYLSDLKRRADKYGIVCPDWVPPNLMAEYYDCALEYGVTMAETYVRCRMRETPSTELGRLIGRS